VPTHVEPPVTRRYVREIAKVENGPIGYSALANRKLRHPVPVHRSGALRLHARESDVDAFPVQLSLTLDIAEALVDQAHCQTVYSCAELTTDDRRPDD
jgi:hypothetical protein